MEASSSEVTRLPSATPKRKAELEPGVDEEEEEEEEIDAEIKARRERRSKFMECEVITDWLAAPEWDVDSFDGVEYYSSSDPTDSSSGEETLPFQHYRLNKQQIIESKGFYSDPKLTPGMYYKSIFPVDTEEQVRPGITFREYWEEMVHICLQKHNQDKPQDSKVEFVKVVRGNYRGAPRSKSYITFMARERPDGPLVEYQAKCMVTFDSKRHPILCRPAPTSKL